MSGLTAFRFGTAPAPEPTTYTGSYATTAQDARDKCQGNVVASVTRSATSTVSLVDAIQKAKALAIAALQCPVFNASYTTTAQDYRDKCGAETSGASVTRSATSGKDQATADAAAKAAALAAIVCPVPVPTYNTPLDKNRPESDGIVFQPAGNQVFSFDAIASTLGNTLSLQITDSSDSSVSPLDFPDDYVGKGFSFKRANGSVYGGTFPNTNLNFSA